MKHALIIGSSKGIGKAIKKRLSELEVKIIAPTSDEFDTSNVDNVKKYIKNLKSIDYLVLNTGGPPAKNFFSITENDWNKYHKQLFLSFVLMMQKIKIDAIVAQKYGGMINKIATKSLKVVKKNELQKVKDARDTRDA